MQIMTNHQLAYHSRNKPPRLLTIPRELRDEIYSALVPAPYKIVHHPKGTGSGCSNMEHGLLNVNKQISTKYLDVICRNGYHVFEIKGEQWLRRSFSIVMSQFMRTKVRRLLILFAHWKGLRTASAPGTATTPEKYAPGDKTVMLHYLPLCLRTILGLQEVALFWEGLDWHPEHELSGIVSTLRALPELKHAHILTRRVHDEQDYQGIVIQPHRKSNGDKWEEMWAREIYPHSASGEDIQSEEFDGFETFKKLKWIN